MNKLQKELDEIFKLISTVPVAGEHVEVMGAARERLRRAYKLAATEEKEGEAHGG